MEARIYRAVLLTALLLVSMGARVRSPNFIVQTENQQFAEQMARTAEKFRRDLAIEWLGKTMPDWSQPCVMTVQVGANLGAGGATTFVFDRGEVFGWRMTIQGPTDRLLDSVLPHEVTHMIFASRFRRPLPRWADEGGASSVEAASEKAKHRQMLQQFLRSNRGIAFNKMYAMTEYPPDVMPLYAQGFSLAEYLIYQGGRQKFVKYLGEGLQSNNWAAATQRNYGIADLGSLQKSWLSWVALGSPALQPATPQPATPGRSGALVANGKLPRPEPNLLYHTGRQENGQPAPAEKPQAQTPVASTEAGPLVSIPATIPTPEAEAVSTQTAHPQAMQQPQQMILQPGQQ
jgi:hypothetical protein